VRHKKKSYPISEFGIIVSVTMKTPHHDHIETAFLQLSFAIKLWNFLDTNPIDKEKFDIDLTIRDSDNCVCLSEGEFHTYDDLILASENNISIAFGATALTLWEAIKEHNAISTKQLNPKSNQKDSLAALSYMLRCCFAHGTAAPVWSIQDPKYKILYRVGNKAIDLSTIADGQAFDYQSIGGYETLWLLRDVALNIGLL
jgi:hypothetical protein